MNFMDNIESMLKTDAIIVGAGIAGLSAAHSLQKKGCRIAVIEKSPRVGGALRSEIKTGYVLEHGPNTVQPKEELWELLEDLKIENQVLLADNKSPRYILLKNQLHPVPMSPLQLATTGILSARGKLRLFKEPFIPPCKSTTDENLLEFSRRRFGTEIADRIIAPFVSGIWAGDAGQLSAKSVFPQLVEWEKKHGSIGKGAFRKKKTSADQGRKIIKGLLSFKTGMETLPQALSLSLGQQIHLQCLIGSIEKKTGHWRITTSKGEFETARLILTTSAFESALLIRSVSPETAGALESIPYVPLAILHFGFKKTEVKHPLNGFGYLVAPSERSNILGCLWTSSLFPGRAPDGHVLLTVFIGGARKSDLMSNSDDRLLRLAFEDISKTLGISNHPSFTSVTRYKKAIPQYTIGHSERIEILKSAEKSLAGLKFTGNYMRGVSVGDVVRHATQTAMELI